MTKEINKCPNCGHTFKQDDTYCPNCDIFIPVNEDQQLEEQTPTNHDHSTDGSDTSNNLSQEADSIFKYRGKTADDIKSNNTTDTEETPSVAPIKEQSEAAKFSEKITQELKGQSEPVSDDLEERNEAEHQSNPSTPDEPEKEEDIIDTTTPAFDTVLMAEEGDKADPVTNVTEDVITHVTPLEERASVTPEDSSNNKKSKRKRLLLGTVAILTLGTGYTVYQYQQKQAESARIEKVTSDIQSELAKYFTHSDHVFLTDSVTTDDIAQLKKQVNELKGHDTYETALNDIENLEYKFQKQTELNNLFKENVLVGDTLNTKAYVVNSDKVTLLPIEDEKDGFDILFNQGLELALKQKEALTSVDTAMKKLFKEDKVIDNPTREDYEAAITSLKAITDPEAKAARQEQLKTAEKKIKDIEEKKAKEAAKKAEEEKKAEEKEAPTNNNTASNPVTNNGQRWGNRQDASFDFSDPAWGWNPGIQDKFIGEVLSRGYVTEGGYSLVPKFVENGEGYYDLYATTNSKLFPNSKPQEFPLYVVTVNVKTGWFKGNGPN